MSRLTDGVGTPVRCDGCNVPRIAYSEKDENGELTNYCKACAPPEANQ